MPRRYTDEEAVEAFWMKVDMSGECWVWTACINGHGYGKVGWKGKSVNAHRVAYMLEVGPIPDGSKQHVDHLCRNRACVRPDHLELVSHRENVLRGVSPMADQARMTHCSWGHEFTPENTGVTKKKYGRYCKKCKARDQRELRKRRKTASSVGIRGVEDRSLDMGGRGGLECSEKESLLAK